MSGNSHHRIYAIVLAAGTASRFGRLKQIEPVAETCLLGIIVRNALMCEGIEKVILVLGAQSDTVKRALGEIAGHEKLTIVVNGEYSKGLSTSLHAGLRKAQADNCDAVTFLLGDMPLIDTGLLESVIARYRSSSCKLCYVKTDGRAGHPIIARKDLFGEFLKVRGDIGGREVVRENIELALGVEVGDSDRDHQLDINDEKDMETYRSLIRE